MSRYAPPSSSGSSGSSGSGLLPANNLSDLTNPATARSNLGLTNMSIWNIVPAASGGTGLSAYGSANQVLAMNTGGTALSYKNFVAGPGMSVSSSATGVNISAIGTFPSGNGKPYDLSQANSFYTVMTSGNYALSVVSGTVGQVFKIKLYQDATGNRTPAWWSGINWDGGTIPTQASGVRKASWYTFFQTGASSYDGFQGGANYA